MKLKGYPGTLLRVLLGLLVTAASAALLSACQPESETRVEAEAPADEGCPILPAVPEEGEMDATKNTAVSTTRPLIDVTAPAATETATFALG